MAASTMSIATTSGAVPGHWLTDEDACRYCEAFATPTDATSITKVENSLLRIVLLQVWVGRC